jgi:deoxyadenosine/deoxycytidine kinase
MIKLSFSGCLGSGKTSLLAEAKKILSLKYTVESLEDMSQKNPFDSDKKSSFISQFFYITQQINEENIKSISSPDILLCDGSVLDLWIQWKKYIGDIEKSNAIEEKNRLIQSIYQFWIKTYDFIFFLRVDGKEMERRKEEDNLVLPDMEYLKEMETIYLDTIAEDKVNVIEIWNNTSVDEGAHSIIKHISEHNQNP